MIRLIENKRFKQAIHSSFLSDMIVKNVCRKFCGQRGPKQDTHKNDDRPGAQSIMAFIIHEVGVLVSAPFYCSRPFASRGASPHESVYPLYPLKANHD